MHGLVELDQRVMRAPARSGLGRGRPVAPKRASKTSHARDQLAFQIRAKKLPRPEVELRFAQELGRQWRFDFAWSQFKIAFEVEGLVVVNFAGRTIVTGRHATITGMREDMDKYNAAAFLGWTVLRGEQSMIKEGASIAMIERTLKDRGWKA